MFNNFSTTEWSVLSIVAILELLLKGVALWKSAQAKHKMWFIALLIFNTFGILPIVYLLFFQKEPLLNNKKKK